MPLARIDSTKGLVIDNQTGPTGQITPAGTSVTVFDCDFTLLSNQSFSHNTPVVLTDQSSRSLTFTPQFINTASASIVNGSGIGFTTGSNGARCKLNTPLSGFSRSAVGSGYRAFIRWNNYTPLGSTISLFTGLQMILQSGIDGVVYFRNNFTSLANNFYSQNVIYTFSINPATAYDIMVIEQINGIIGLYAGTWSSGWPALSSMALLSVGPIAQGLYLSGSTPQTMNTALIEPQFANLTDNTSRTMFLRNMKIETF